MSSKIIIICFNIKLINELIERIVIICFEVCLRIFILFFSVFVLFIIVVSFVFYKMNKV